MSLIFRMVVAASLLVIPGQVSLHAFPRPNKDKEEVLIGKIERENNPGKKARLQLRLAKLKLKEAGQAYDTHDFEKGKAFLRQYLGYVRDSWATLQGADSDVRKHLRAFKDLEISLREDDRFLEDLRHHVPYPESENVRKVAEESRAVHNQVLEAIFPDGKPPGRNQKRLRSPKSAVPAKLGALQS
ncbi:MAG TPA: hypothetical protein VFL79_02050 [Terriglobia bacterium]|nr:hypothetical protein [Terriglobia bacterium]